MMTKLKLLCGWLLLLLGLAACGGTKMLRKPEPLPPTQLLAAASDERLSATLQAVIFRSGPGSWAKNVDWDEYLLGFRNLGGEPIQIKGITVSDSLGTPIQPGLDRQQLVRGTRDAKRRYKGQGLTVEAGVNGGVLVGAGAAAAAGTSGIGAAAMAGGGAAVGAAAVVLLVPALAVGGVVRGVNNSKVNGEIERRQTLLPIVLAPNEDRTAHVFFPVSPSPCRVEFSYLGPDGDHVLTVDTMTVLQGLHLANSEPASLQGASSKQRDSRSAAEDGTSQSDTAPGTLSAAGRCGALSPM